MEPDKHGFRVVIATAPFGQGHITTAEAISRSLALAWPDAELQVVDVAQELYRRLPMAAVMRGIYRQAATRRNGKLHQLLYSAFDRWPQQLSSIVDTLWGRRVMRAVERRGRVDLAIATYSTVAYILRKRLRQDVPSTLR